MRGLFFPFWIPPPFPKWCFPSRWHWESAEAAGGRGFEGSALLEHFDGVDSWNSFSFPGGILTFRGAKGLLQRISFQTSSLPLW